MRKGNKALAVLSLFGLGLGSVTACGGSSKSITISVNGTAIPNGGSVTVDELSTVKFSAIVDGGSETDTVVWATDSPTAFKFDSTTGNEVSAVANAVSSTGWTISASLESDASVNSTIKVMVNEAKRTYEVTIDDSEARTVFFVGDAFTTEGLKVNVTEFINAEKGESFPLGSDEYTTSIEVGTVLDELGTQTVTVTPNDSAYNPVTYDILVTEDPTTNMAADFKDMATNGYVEYAVQQDKASGDYYLMPYNIYGKDYAFVADMGYFYERTATQINQYYLTYNDNKEDTLSYETIIYTNKKPETNWDTFLRRISLSGVLPSDWDDSYLDYIVADSKTGAAIATDDAAVFFNEIFGQGLVDSSTGDFIPYDVEISLITDATGEAMDGIYMLNYTYEGETVYATILGTYQSDAQNMISALKSIADKKDPNNYEDNSDGFVEANVETILNDMAGSDYLAYQSQFTGDLFLYTPDFNEVQYGQLAQSINYELIVQGNYKLDTDSTVGSSDKVYSAGTLIYGLDSSKQLLLGQDTEGTEPSFEDRDVRRNSFSGLTTSEALKYWNFDNFTTSTFVDQSNTQYTGYIFTYSLYTSEFDPLDIIHALDWGFGSIELEFNDGRNGKYFDVVYDGATGTQLSLSLSLIPNGLTS